MPQDELAEVGFKLKLKSYPNPVCICFLELMLLTATLLA